MSPVFYSLLMFGIVVITGLFTFFPTYKNMKQSYKRDVKLDISLEQMRASEHRLSLFYAAHEIKPGDLEEAAKILNVEQSKVYFGTSNEQARIKTGGDGKWEVTLKEGLSEAEQRFYFAHECAHIINNDPIPATRPSEKNKPEIEQLADYTAAAMLMPNDEIYSYLTAKNYERVSRFKRAHIIDELCRRYRVSEVIVMRRINEIYALKKSL